MCFTTKCLHVFSVSVQNADLKQMSSNGDWFSQIKVGDQVYYLSELADINTNCSAIVQVQA